MTNYTKPVLEQDKAFIKKTTPLDFTKNMGQYALEVEYTNGDTQMFTTKSSNPNQFGTHEFETKEDMLNFQKELT